MKQPLTAIPVPILKRLEYVDKVKCHTDRLEPDVIEAFYRSLQDLVDDWQRQRDEIAELQREISDILNTTP